MQQAFGRERPVLLARPARHRNKKQRTEKRHLRVVPWVNSSLQNVVNSGVVKFVNAIPITSHPGE